MRTYKPSSSGLQGASVIDKEDIFANNIYSGGPGSFKRPYRNLTRVTRESKRLVEVLFFSWDEVNPLGARHFFRSLF